MIFLTQPFNISSPITSVMSERSAMVDVVGRSGGGADSIGVFAGRQSMALSRGVILSTCHDNSARAMRIIPSASASKIPASLRFAVSVS